jgi:pimeloyl-ACP methyl ester carboxylesterase
MLPLPSGATRVVSWGTHGSPIVLVHGFVETADAFDALGPVLARAGHRVYAYDVRGFGWSARGAPYGDAPDRRQLAELIRALHLRRPLLVGHSMGGGVIASLALRQPQLAGGLVFLDADGLNSGEGFGGPLAGPFAAAALGLALSQDWLMRSILRTAYAPHVPGLTHRLIDWWRRPLRRAGTAQALAAMARAPQPGVTHAQLARVRVRSAVVWGAGDRVLPLEDGRRTAATLHAPLWVVPAAGHLAPISDPRPVARLILRLLR